MEKADRLTDCEPETVEKGELVYKDSLGVFKATVRCFPFIRRESKK